MPTNCPVCTATAARVAAALAKLNTAGKLPRALPPYGYMRVGLTVVPHPLEQQVILEIVAMHASGLTLRAIGAALGSRGLRERAVQWHAIAVSRVLERETRSERG